MISLSDSTEIYIGVEPIHMNKYFNGLAALVSDVIEQNPLSGKLFVFRNRRKDKLKIFYWDRNGFVIWYKRLDKGRFKFPKSDALSYSITQEDLKLLLDGINLDKLKRFPELYYQAAL